MFSGEGGPSRVQRLDEADEGAAEPPHPSFNEPDLAEQANMPPLEAAIVWKAEIENFSGSAKLVSPGVTNGVKTPDGKKMGVPWLLDFVAACTDCTIDAYAVSETSSRVTSPDPNWGETELALGSAVALV